MTTTSMNLPLHLNIKTEKNEIISNDGSDETDGEDSDDFGSLLYPSILDNDCFSRADPKDEFLHLTSMVRRVYFSYLHKSIINNYNVCCTTIKNKKISRAELKRCASLLELNAVRASLATSLYRQAMLKIISDIKNNTNQRQIHNQLVVFLDTPSKTADAVVQTSFDMTSIEEAYLNMQNNTESLYDAEIEQFNYDLKVDKNLVKMFEKNTANGTFEAENELIINKEEKWDKKDKVELPEVKEDIKKSCIKDNGSNNENVKSVDDNINTSIQHIFGSDSEVGVHDLIQNDNQESRDSLIEHLETMFCESDDSSDLMTLIEKHSGISKTNVDKEINKMCPKVAVSTATNISSSIKISEKIEISNKNISNAQSNGKRKLSFKNYKKMKRRAAVDETGNPQTEESKEDILAKKKKGIWFVERVHQVSKLKNKMMELSVRNYRKHGKLRAKFIQLFGDSDEEDMMPESPIRIEEHLTACRERIAPWVVKCLMPYYTKKVIQDRLLFKAVAKHVSDVLLLENTFPEEECVSQYINNYFRNKPSIQSEADIYV